MIVMNPNGSAEMMLSSGERSPIVRWEVWFSTPIGVHKDLEIAINKMQEIDFPVHVIKPVPVAFCEGDDYEVCP